METKQYQYKENLEEQIELAGSDDPEVRRNLLLQGAHSEILSIFKAAGTREEKNLAYLIGLSPSEYEELQELEDFQLPGEDPSKNDIRTRWMFGLDY